MRVLLFSFHRLAEGSKEENDRRGNVIAKDIRDCPLDTVLGVLFHATILETVKG